MIKKHDVLKGNFSFDGTPWVNVTQKTKFKSKNLQFSLNGEGPWIAISSGNVKKINGIELKNIKTCSNTFYRNIKKAEKLDY